MSSWPGTAPSTEYGLGNSYPVYWVSWDEAKEFISALNAHITNTSQGPATVRLPSEAEREYACRAGTTTRFYWGDDPSYAEIGTFAWYSGNNTPNGSKPVGGKLPNAFGLYDISGNVYEWCEDDWHGTYSSAPSDGSAWVDSPSRGTFRVQRCGSWGGDPSYCRAAYRSFEYPLPANGYSNHGFRIAR